MQISASPDSSLGKWDRNLWTLWAVANFDCFSKNASMGFSLGGKKENPFGFTPYDSGELLGDYMFSDKMISAINRISEGNEDL